MKRTMLSLILMLSTALSYGADLTSCSISPVNVSGVFDHYNVQAYGLLPNGEVKSINLTSSDDIAAANAVFNDDSFVWSGTMYRTWMIWTDSDTLNRIDFQTSVTPSGNVYKIWSEAATAKISTLKTLIESK